MQLCEEVVLGFPLPVWERDRVRGKVAATNLLTQMKSAVKSVGIAVDSRYFRMARIAIPKLAELEIPG